MGRRHFSKESQVQPEIDTKSYTLYCEEIENKAKRLLLLFLELRISHCKTPTMEGVWFIEKSGIIFPKVLHFSKCAAFFQMFRIFPNVPHFSKCAAFLQMYCIFPNMRHISQCAVAIFRMRRIFTNVLHFSKNPAFFQMCYIFPNRPHFSKCASIFQLMHFSKLNAFFQIKCAASSQSQQLPKY